MAQAAQIHQTETEKDIELLNASLSGEYFGIAAYDAAISTGLLEDEFVAVAKKFQGDHKQHAQRLQEAIIGLGGTPIETETWEQYAAAYPPPPLANQADIIRYAASLEQSGASGTVATIGDLSSPELIRLAASIAGVEAMHWSALLAALGENPVPVSFIPLPSE